MRKQYDIFPVNCSLIFSDAFRPWFIPFSFSKGLLACGPDESWQLSAMGKDLRLGNCQNVQGDGERAFWSVGFRSRVLECFLRRNGAFCGIVSHPSRKRRG